ncbi:Calcineurin-like phosphoesterase [Carpediemonas membranifera]|uniref:Serine/threonine-protein phosphatase n=1 Tax=Carpediemonas membranifera TaxID=201153 RepID=A0A8J6B4X2_9EUKA|nr:Calcineurin-like phosphoesterase [Carpediemonas membranifera]|eukprot:KAG9394369.1 Calcineurin-like phosphoesterase [Carpediemonas membranifera]
MEPSAYGGFEDDVTISALSRPQNDTVARVMSDVEPPELAILSVTDVYGNESTPDPNVLIEHFKKEGRISKNLIERILVEMTAMLGQEPNLLNVDAPVTVVGDLHGQFYDLVRLLELAGDPEKTRYLFLGDYIDRGTFSLETTITLYSMKLRYPKNVFLLRGNHECRQMADFFNFRLEILHKQDNEVLELFQKSFDHLPLAAIVDNRFFAVHGGISPELKTTGQINKINRFREPPESGLMTDLLWSDPAVKDGPTVGFKSNTVRGCGHTYGFAAVAKFLEANHLLCVVRGHEAQNDGFKMHRTHPSTKFPTVITVFSAPNYCGNYANKAALLFIGPKTINVKQFSYSDQPYVLPNFQNIFDWSMPFVIENVTELLLTMTSRLGEETDSDDSSEDEGTKEDPAVRRKRVLAKIQAVSRMARFARILREERETIIKLKGIAGTSKLPVGLLQGGSEAIDQTLTSFQRALELDMVNEMAPHARRQAKKEIIEQIVRSVLQAREESIRAWLEGRAVELTSEEVGTVGEDTEAEYRSRIQHRASFETGESVAPAVQISAL